MSGHVEDMLECEGCVDCAYKQGQLRHLKSQVGWHAKELGEPVVYKLKKCLTFTNSPIRRFFSAHVYFPKRSGVEGSPSSFLIDEFDGPCPKGFGDKPTWFGSQDTDVLSIH